MARSEVGSEEKRRKRRQRSGSGKIRMEEVARAAGVSPSSVSRALRAPNSVSPEVYAKVRDIADRLGYERSPIAGGLSGARTSLIGVIVPTMINAFFNRTIQAISSAIEAAGYQLMMGAHEYDLAREERLIAAFLAWQPAAIVVTGVHHSRGANNLLAGAKCPVVEMWDLDGRPIDSVVGFSMTDAGRAAAEHLIKRGRKKLVYVGNILDRDTRAAARAAGFMAEVGRHPGVTGMVLSSVGRNAWAGLQIMKEIKELHPQTDGIAFSGDAVALGALTAAENLGIQVPRDIAIIGFGDLESAPFSRPPLTTIRPPQDLMGQTIAEHVLQRIEDPNLPSKIVDLGFELVVRESA